MRGPVDPRAPEEALGDAASDDATVEREQFLNVKSQAQIHSSFEVLSRVVPLHHSGDHQGAVGSRGEERGSRHPGGGTKETS